MTSLRSSSGPLYRPGNLIGSHAGRRIAAALALLLLAAWLLRPSTGAASLAEVRLEGPRGPACLRVVVAQDVSGSMSAFSTPRDDALRQFLAWAPQNLRSDDEIGVLQFAANAGWTLSPIRVGEPTSPLPSGVLDGRDTKLHPVLDAVRPLPTAGCDAELILLSDGQLADLPASAEDGRAALASAHVHGLSLLVPGEDIEVPAMWPQAFPAAEPVRFNGSDPDATGLAFAGVIARATGQTLVRR